MTRLLAFLLALGWASVALAQTQVSPSPNAYGPPLDFAAPPPLGNTTPNTVKATTVVSTNLATGSAGCVGRDTAGMLQPSAPNPCGSVTTVQTTPGLTTQVGVCNTSLQTITVSGQINQQQCMRTVTVSTAGNNADSGYLVKMNCNGCTYTAINPTGAGGNQGVFFDITGDGNSSDSYIVTTAGGTADFKDCPLGGGTSMTLPGNVQVHIVSNPDNNATTYYHCAQYNGTITITTTNNYTGGFVLISSQTVTTPVAEMDFTSLPTTYRALTFRCNNIYQSAAVALLVQSGEGGGPTWNTTAHYQVSGYNLTSTGTVVSPESTATASDATDLSLGYYTSPQSVSFTIEIDNPANTGVYKNLLLAAGGPVEQVNFNSQWVNDTNALTALRLIPASGTINGGKCSLWGEN